MHDQTVALVRSQLFALGDHASGRQHLAHPPDERFTVLHSPSLYPGRKVRLAVSEPPDAFFGPSVYAAIASIAPGCTAIRRLRTNHAGSGFYSRQKSVTMSNSTSMPQR